LPLHRSGRVALAAGDAEPRPIRRLGVVSNPTAGGGHAAHAGRRVVRALTAQGFEVRDLSADNLPSATAHVKQGVVSGLDALIVVGGDGMVHLGTEMVAGTSLPLGIVATGTGNDVARTLGLPVRDVDKGVAAVTEAIAAGPRVIDAVHVTDAQHRMGDWYLGVLTAGLDAAVNQRTNRLKHPSGSARYVRALVHELAHFHPYGYRVTVDGELWESAGTLVSVANGRGIGGGMLIAPDARFDDGLLDVVTAGPLSRRAIVKVFPKIYSGRHLDHPLINVVRGRVVTIEPAPALGGAPPDALADGEPVGPLPLRCEVVPGAVHVLAPRRPAPARVA
jgi:diacylglycerol kinase (ATP)